MLLQPVLQYNDLSPELREEIEAKVRGYGNSARYKFNISNHNPDPAKTDGAVLWPNVYTLDPTVFTINDPYEKRPGKQRSKTIGIVEKLTPDAKLVEKFKKVRIEGKHKGVLSLDIENNNEHYEMACYLELHPKMVGGKFLDKTKMQIFSVIDESAHAKEQRNTRKTKKTAMDYAASMSDTEVVNFGLAMQWEEGMEVERLRNDIEALAETSPEYFNDLVEGKNIEIQAAIQEATNKGIIAFDPVEWRFLWASNRQPITAINPTDTGKTEVVKMAEWVQTSGTSGTEFLKKIKGLLAAKPQPTT